MKRVAVAATAALLLTGCTTSGTPMTIDEINFYLSLSLSVGYTLDEEPRNADKGGTYRFHDDNGIDFTCTVDTEVVNPIPGAFVWATRCDYASEWVQAHSAQLAAGFGNMEVDFAADERTDHPDEITMDVYVKTWSEVTSIAPAITEILNGETIPVKNSDGTLRIPIPQIAVYIGKSWAHTSALAKWPFPIEESDKVSQTDIAAALEDAYADAVVTGDWEDDSVPPEIIIEHSPAVVDFDYERVPMFETEFDRDHVQYLLPADTFCRNVDSATASPSETPTPQTPLTDYARTFAEWVQRLGGTYTAANCQATWTINGHTWIASQPGSFDENSKEFSSDKPSVTKDSQQPALSLDGYVDQDGHYRFTLPDIEQLLGVSAKVTDNVNYSQKAVGKITLAR